MLVTNKYDFWKVELEILLPKDYTHDGVDKIFENIFKDMRIKAIRNYNRKFMGESLMLKESDGK